MATIAMVRTYVRHLLEEDFGEELVVLGENSYEVPVAGGVRVWVVDGNERSRRILVTTPVIEVDGPTPEVLEVVNELNAVTPYGRYFVDDAGGVVVEDTLLAAALEPTALFGSIAFVAWASETHAEVIAERLGGVEASPAGATAADVTVDDRVAPVARQRASGRASRPDGDVVNAAGYL